MKKKEWKQRCKEYEKELAYWHSAWIGEARRCCDFREAAEFEARVAKRLARRMGFSCYRSECPWNRMNPKDSTRCIHSFEFGFCRLRDARIEVEEELDG